MFNLHHSSQVNRTTTVQNAVMNLLNDLYRLENVQNEHELLSFKLKETTESTMSAEERAFRMEELLKEEENRIHEVQKELARLREIQVCPLENMALSKQTVEERKL